MRIDCEADNLELEVNSSYGSFDSPQILQGVGVFLGSNSVYINLLFVANLGVTQSKSVFKQSRVSWRAFASLLLDSLWTT